MPVLVCPLSTSFNPGNPEANEPNALNVQHAVLRVQSEEQARLACSVVPSTAELDAAIAALRSEINQKEQLLRESAQQLKSQIENKFSETTLAALQKLPVDVKDLLKPLLVAELKSYIDQKFDELREQLLLAK